MATLWQPIFFTVLKSPRLWQPYGNHFLTFQEVQRCGNLVTTVFLFQIVQGCGNLVQPLFYRSEKLKAVATLYQPFFNLLKKWQAVITQWQPSFFYPCKKVEGCGNLVATIFFTRLQKWTAAITQWQPYFFTLFRKCKAVIAL